VSEKVFFELALVQIAILVIASRVLGEVFIRFKLPVIVGEIVAGIILGPAILGILYVNPEIKLFIALGIYLLLFLVGFEEVDLKNVARALHPKNVLAALTSFLVPFIMYCYFLPFYLGEEWAVSVLVASVLALTSIGVVVRCLTDLNLLNTVEGANLINIAILSEVLGLIVASITLELMLYPDANGYYLLPVKIVAFFVLAAFIGYHVAPLIIREVENKFKVKEASFAALITLILLFSAAAVMAGLHGIFGALILGFMLSRKRDDFIINRSVQQLKGFAYGIFIPIFFAGIGLYVTLDFLSLNFLTIVSFALIILAGKLLGGYLGSRILALRGKPGVLTMGQLCKGGVELAILSLALALEVITRELYSFIVIMVILLAVLSSISLNILGSYKYEDLNLPERVDLRLRKSQTYKKRDK